MSTQEQWEEFSGMQRAVAHGDTLGLEFVDAVLKVLELVPLERRPEASDRMFDVIDAIHRIRILR